MIKFTRIIAKQLPPGIYALVSGDDIVYVGQSIRPAIRIAEHAQAGKQFDFAIHIEASELDTRELLDVESACIQHIAPIMNHDKNGKLHHSNISDMTLDFSKYIDGLSSAAKERL